MTQTALCPERARQMTAFRMLVMGIFANHPTVSQSNLVGVSEEDLSNRYGPEFRRGLTTFYHLSSAEQVYLIHHLQR